MQQVLFGNGKINFLKEIILEKGFNAAFIVTGEHFLADIVHQPSSLLNGLQHYHYIKKKGDVSIPEIENCLQAFQQQPANVIVAIGGGSVIDLTKAVIFSQHKQNLSKPFFIAVPTTAGSGSEATCFAVAYKNKRKFSLEHAVLLPDVSILDPELTYNLPATQTAISGIDALAHAIESVWNIHATEESIMLAEEAISILIDNLPQAVHHPTALVREKTLWGAHVAGKAINITRSTGSHACSYYLSGHFYVAHGQAVALFLPLFFLYNAAVNRDNCNDTNGVDAVNNRLQRLYDLLGVENSEQAMHYLRHFILNIGLAINLQMLQIDKAEILEAWVNEIDEERFKNNPVKFDKEALISLYQKYL